MKFSALQSATSSQGNANTNRSSANSNQEPAGFDPSSYACYDDLPQDQKANFSPIPNDPEWSFIKKDAMRIYLGTKEFLDNLENKIQILEESVIQWESRPDRDKIPTTYEEQIAILLHAPNVVQLDNLARLQQEYFWSGLWETMDQAIRNRLHEFAIADHYDFQKRYGSLFTRMELVAKEICIKMKDGGQKLWVDPESISASVLWGAGIGGFGAVVLYVCYYANQFGSVKDFSDIGIITSAAVWTILGWVVAAAEMTSKGKVSVREKQAALAKSN